MLDKARNHLIDCAFRKANITSLESVPTQAEIEDAAHTLNVMLQSWNNDGFRLFKIKTGYMPFIPMKGEYSLAHEAYKRVELGDVVNFERIGATKIKLKSFSNVSAGQKLVVLNNVLNENSIGEYDAEEGVLVLSKEAQEPLYDEDTVFFGSSFSSAKTTVQSFGSPFQTIPYSDEIVSPQVGNVLFLNVNYNWQRCIVTGVNTNAKTVTLTDESGNNLRGNITNAFIFFGSSVYKTSLVGNYPIEARVITVKGLEYVPYTIAIVDADKLGDVLAVESASTVDNDTEKRLRIVLKAPLSEDELKSLGANQIDANIKYPTSSLLKWSDIASQVPIDALDWGSITDSSDLQTDDWGNVADAASVLENWGTLTGYAQITGFGKIANDMYATVYDSDNNVTYLFYKAYGTSWTNVDVSAYSLTKSTLYMAAGSLYLVDPYAGVYSLFSGGLTEVYTTNGVEKIIAFGSLFYLVSPISLAGLRTVVSTADFASFSNSWTISLASVANPAEFLNKLYIGRTDTFVTGDMKSISDIHVYSEARSVVGDRLLNMNTEQYCSFSKDGVNFLPMPLMVSNQTAWGYKDGCTFIAVYGIMVDGVVGTQIYTTNDFNPVWAPQVKVEGRVFDIQFDDQYAYFTSDVEVVSLEYRDMVVANAGLTMFGFGEAIGRPQQIMNVIKFGFRNQMQLPMNALALKDFVLLPHEGLGGEPVNYCFFREAEDGKMLVWGTPNKFGEYLRFSYVEPITLLEDARSTPDFPDEYYEAVEDGLASQLAMQYGAPVERQQILEARAKESKENAILHDNEDVSYNMAPNERWR